MRGDIGTRLLTAFGSLLLVAILMGVVAVRTTSVMAARIVGITDVEASGIEHAGAVQRIVSQLQSRLGQIVIVTAKGDTRGVAATSRQIDQELDELEAELHALQRTASDQETAALCAEVLGAISALHPDGIILTPPHSDNDQITGLLAAQGLPFARIGSQAEGPGFAHAMTKRMLQMEWAMSVEQAIEAEAVAQALCMTTGDFRRAYEGFVARRRPEFKGD